MALRRRQSMHADAVAQRPQWDALAAIIASLVGLLALVVSGYTAYIQRQQVRAQVWPYLETALSGSKHELMLTNKGVGPAIIHSLQILVDGAPQHTWEQVFTSLGLHFDKRPPYSTVSTVVIAPYDHIDHVIFATVDDFNAYIRVVNRVETKICYCSTLGECWMYNERVNDPDHVHQLVDSCPARGPDDLNDTAAEPVTASKENQ